MDFKPIIQLVHAVLPPFNMATITNYFIKRITCDGKSAMDFKSLNTKAFPLFKDGHVQNIMACIRDQNLVIQAVCLPEMKKSHTYKVELIQHIVSSDIVASKCGCPAGCGPNGSCKHIAAVCYALEEFNRIKTTKEYIASTSKLQEWNRPRKRVLDAQDVSEIKFMKLEHAKVKRENLNPIYDPRPKHLQHTSITELDAFCHHLADRVAFYMYFLQIQLSLPPLLPQDHYHQYLDLFEKRSL